MPKIYELVENFASQFSNDYTREVWFTKLDLKIALSQHSPDNFTSSQSNFGLVGGDKTDLEICRRSSRESWTQQWETLLLLIATPKTF